jgi:hypothetical protein
MKNQLRKHSSILMIALLAVSCQKSGSEDQQSGGTLIASKPIPLRIKKPVLRMGR